MKFIPSKPYWNESAKACEEKYDVSSRLRQIRAIESLADRSPFDQIHSNVDRLKLYVSVITGKPRADRSFTFVIRLD